jgi:hypothetical protein
LPVRPGMPRAMMDQLRGPWRATERQRSSSSCVVARVVFILVEGRRGGVSGRGRAGGGEGRERPAWRPGGGSGRPLSSLSLSRARSLLLSSTADPSCARARGPKGSRGVQCSGDGRQRGGEQESARGPRKERVTRGGQRRHRSRGGCRFAPRSSSLLGAPPKAKTGATRDQDAAVREVARRRLSFMSSYETGGRGRPHARRRRERGEAAGGGERGEGGEERRAQGEAKDCRGRSASPWPGARPDGRYYSQPPSECPDSRRAPRNGSLLGRRRGRFGSGWVGRQPKKHRCGLSLSFFQAAARLAKRPHAPPWTRVPWRSRRPWPSV